MPVGQAGWLKLAHAVSVHGLYTYLSYVEGLRKPAGPNDSDSGLSGPRWPDRLGGLHWYATGTGESAELYRFVHVQIIYIYIHIVCICMCI